MVRTCLKAIMFLREQIKNIIIIIIIIKKKALGGLQIPRWLGSDPLSAWWSGLAPATLEFWVRFPNERNQGKQAHPVLKYRVPHGSQPRPGWALDPPMVGIRSPVSLVVGSCTSHPGVLGSIPKQEEPGKTGARVGLCVSFREKILFIHDATHAEGTYKTKTLGSRLGSLMILVILHTSTYTTN